MRKPEGPSHGLRPLRPDQVAAAAAIGTAIEFYDFVLYSFLASTVFAPLFFPQLVPWLGTLAVLGGHAVAIVARPVGAVVFGLVGDRLGRRVALVGSLSLMGVATVGIGVLPSYASIGAPAALLLVLLRVVQGLAIGGEYPGAVVVAVEHAGPTRRTFFGAFSQIGAVTGLLLAAVSLLGVDLVVGERTFREWGWRLPFLLSAVLVVVGLVLRARLVESPEFVAAHRAGIRRAGRLGAVLRAEWRPLGAATLMWTGPVALGYAFLTGLFTYVALYVPALRVADVLVGLVLSAVLVVGLTAVSGWFGDRWGARRVVAAAGIWAAVWAVPGYLLVGLGSVPALWTAMVAAGAAYGAFGGVAPALVSQAFPVEVRYLAVGIALAVSGVLGAAVLPLPALALVGVSGGSPLPLMLMVVVGGIATAAGGLLLRSRPPADRAG
jgi:MFS family permease